MSMKESLSGISTELGKILQQLREIESVQGRLSSSAGSYAKALSGVGAGVGGNSIGGSGFSTPPPAPGSQAGGVMATSPGGGVAAPPAEGGGMGKGIAGAFGALFTAGYNFLPSTTDSVAYQSAFFRPSFMGQGGYKEDDLAKMRAMFGNRQSDPFGMVTAANAATMSGMGIGTSHFSTVMRQTATTSMLFGQSNATAAQAQTSLYSGPTAGRLGNIGIFVSSLKTGDPRAFGDIIDQIWGRAYGNKNAKVPYESVMADLRGGYLGAWLRRNFSDNPALYDQIYQALVLKANANGRSLDYSDLTGKNGLNRMTAGTGSASAMGAGRSLGLTESNDPMYFASRGYGAQARAIEGAMDEMVGAWSASMDKLIDATSSYADAMAEGNRLLESVSWIKGLTQSIGSNPVMNPLVLGPLGYLAGSLFGGRAKGGVGTSTSDSIPAMLSKGEYVINARAAQAIGVEQLNALNAVGHDFGSGFASPTRFFDKGGTTLSGWEALSPGDSRLKNYNVGGFTFTLREDYAPMVLKTINDYQRLLGPMKQGYSYREGGGAMGGGTTDHQAGVAFDVDWTAGRTWGWPPGLGKSPVARDLTAAERTAINQILSSNPGIEWGGNWSGSMYDPMHFEVESPKVSPPGAGSPTTSGASGSLLDKILSIARSKIGAPYVVGADGPDEFDCSGFTQWVFKQVGIGLSDVSYTQVNEGQRIATAKSVNDTVSWSLAQAGDLLFFDTDAHENDPSGLGISHVGIYAGSDKMIHAWGPPLAETDLNNYNSPLRAITRHPLGGAVPDTSAQAPTPKSSRGEPSGPPVAGISASTMAGKTSVYSLGGFTGGSRGLSLGLSKAFSWVGGNLFGTTQRGGIASPVTAQKESTDDTVTTTGKSDSVAEPTGNVGSGSGPEWLYSYLVSKGLRGNTLKTAWVIGMRESGGTPSKQSKDKYGGSWTSSGEPHYDVGLYQINNRHLSTVQKRYGGDMRQMLDLEKNYDMTTYMSKNWSNLLAWALEPDGQTFNWSMYNPIPGWASASMANHRRLWGEYDQYNTQNYSEGAYRTHEGLAKIHEGEMVLPANVAERFREMMRDMGGPKAGHQGDINITLKIEKASDAEAERFARKVKKLLQDDSWESAMRTR